MTMITATTIIDISDGLRHAAEAEEEVRGAGGYRDEAAEWNIRRRQRRERRRYGSAVLVVPIRSVLLRKY